MLPPLLKGDNCIVGSIGWPSHGGGLGRTRFTRSWQLKLSAPETTTRHNILAESPLLRAVARSVSTCVRAESVEGLHGVCEEFQLCQIAHAAIVRKTPRRTLPTAACKFGLKRTAGSLCAAVSDRLTQSACR